MRVNNTNIILSEYFSLRHFGYGVAICGFMTFLLASWLFFASMTNQKQFEDALELSVSDEQNRLEKISLDQKSQDDDNATPEIIPESKKMLSFVVFDVGISKSVTDLIFEKLSPETVSIALSPYSPDFEMVKNAFLNKGYDVWLSLPTEARDINNRDRGELTLSAHISKVVFTDRVNRLAELAKGTNGLIGAYNSALYDYQIETSDMIKKFYQEGLLFIDSDISPQTVPQKLSLAFNKPYAYADLWLDRFISKEYISERIKEIARIVKNQDKTTAFIDANELSVKMLGNFINGIESDRNSNYPDIVPVSKQLELNFE